MENILHHKEIYPQSSNVLAPLPSIKAHHHCLKKYQKKSKNTYLGVANNVKAAEGETARQCADESACWRPNQDFYWPSPCLIHISRCSNPACKSTESCNFLGKQITQSGSHPWHVQIKQWPMVLAHTRMVSDFCFLNFNPCNLQAIKLVHRGPATSLVIFRCSALWSHAPVGVKPLLERRKVGLWGGKESPLSVCWNHIWLTVFSPANPFNLFLRKKTP